MSLRRLIIYASSSLRAHVIVVGTCIAVPIAILGLWLNYDEGTLTLLWGLWVIFGCAVVGAAVAVLGWYTIMPSIKRRQ